MSAEIPPSLPKYEAPKERPTAVIPQGLEVTKMPGTMNKMISKMLPKMKLSKIKAPKMKSRMSKTKTKHRLKIT